MRVYFKNINKIGTHLNQKNISISAEQLFLLLLFFPGIILFGSLASMWVSLQLCYCLWYWCSAVSVHLPFWLSPFCPVSLLCWCLSTLVSVSCGIAGGCICFLSLTACSVLIAGQSACFLLPCSVCSALVPISLVSRHCFLHFPEVFVVSLKFFPIFCLYLVQPAVYLVLHACYFPAA